MIVLSGDTKNSVAMALILLKDFEIQGRGSKDKSQVLVEILGLARYLGVYSNFMELISEVPEFEIKPKS